MKNLMKLLLIILVLSLVAGIPFTGMLSISEKSWC